MNNESKKILVIWWTSKIGQAFMNKYKNSYTFIYTHSSSINSSTNSIALNLLSKRSIDNFITKINEIEFDGILLLSSIYADNTWLKNPLDIFTVNVVGYYKILQSIKIKSNSKIVFFTDAGTLLPKHKYSFYTVAKDMLKSYIKTYAVERKDLVILGIDMWPVATEKTGKAEEKFFNRSPMKYVKNPINGLTSLLNFLINEEDFYSTGSIIDFSWWTYLIRNIQNAR